MASTTSSSTIATATTITKVTSRPLSMLLLLVCMLMISMLAITDAASSTSSTLSGFERTVAASGHTNNWAVLACTSRYWFNYRHVANTLSMYHSVRRLGIPDSHIILMLSDDMACNSRNKYPGTIFNNAGKRLNIYSGMSGDDDSSACDDVEVDYRGYEVTVENFIRVLTGRFTTDTPRGKRLLSDNQSNILVYVTGHGGSGFLKFQDAEEITNQDFADAFEQMWQKKRYNNLLFMADTCQASTLYSLLYSPNIIAAGSSLEGENSYSYLVDHEIGVAMIDRFTFYLLEFLEGVDVANIQASLGEMFDSLDPKLLHSHHGVRTDLFPRKLHDVPITDFFGNRHRVRLTRYAFPMALEDVKGVVKEFNSHSHKDNEGNHSDTLARVSHSLNSHFDILVSRISNSV